MPMNPLAPNYALGVVLPSITGALSPGKSGFFACHPKRMRPNDLAYRSFSPGGSNGLSAKGFLRVKITQ